MNLVGLKIADRRLSTVYRQCVLDSSVPRQSGPRGRVNNAQHEVRVWRESVASERKARDFHRTCLDLFAFAEGVGV